MSRSRHSVRPQPVALGTTSRLSYFFGKAIANLQINRLVTLITIFTITLALLIISLFMLAYVNMEGAITRWSSKIAVSVYFDKEPPPQELHALKSRIQGLPGTDTVQFISKDDAYKRFRSRLKGQESLLEGVTTDILPSSLEISIKREFRSSDAVSLYANRLKQVVGSGEVQYGEEWVEKFLSFFQFVRVVSLLVASFLILSVLFIVSNTIKLTVLARKDELEIMALVGATSSFIKAPFLIEGMIQGAAGAVLSLVTLAALYYALMFNSVNFFSFNPSTSGIMFLPPLYIAVLFFGGILLGFIGSLASLKKLITI